MEKPIRNRKPADPADVFYSPVNTVSEIRFEIYAAYHEDQMDWEETYMVSIDEWNSISVDKETWDEITKDYFDIIKHGLPYLTFQEVFGNSSEFPI